MKTAPCPHSRPPASRLSFSGVRHAKLRRAAVAGLALILTAAWTGHAAAAFTPLTPLPAPQITDSTTSYPGGNYEAGRLLDGDPKTEYSSDGRGTNTTIEFTFAAPTRLGAIRHLDRNDPATIAQSELVALDATGRPLPPVPIRHVNRPGGETFFVLPEPITAQKFRWRVSELGQSHRTVGGAELAFFAVGPAEPAPTRDRIEVRTAPVIRLTNGVPTQDLRVTLHHAYAEPVEAQLHVDGANPVPVRLSPGGQTVIVPTPIAKAPRTVALRLAVAGQTVADAQFKQDPVQPLTVYVLPHSHTDIGYTEIQTEIEDKQVRNLIDGMAIARRTANYPPGARFVWNVEVLWAADLYLRRLDEAHRREFLEAVKSGQVALNGMYLNELTGLCRPEELIRLFRQAAEIGAITGVPVESAMISDVPGYTWGTVTAMAQAGIKYFSVAPNYFDRIGDILVQWENKPFYWLAPDRKSKVLVWIPFWGYAMSHRYHRMSPQLIEEFCDGLAQRQYPYDIAYVRWSGHGDNATPDPAICDFIRDWNASHVSPRFVISSTAEAFRVFEAKHGDRLPQAAGDWTPYWEDGAGSSALETALNRASSDRLAQAETVWALLNPRAYPAPAFQEAWRNVLLYSEHTWGAWCSIGEPARRETREQWAIKQSYAVAADLQSRDLLSRALAQTTGPTLPDAIDIINTASWPRTETAIVPKFLSEGRNRVTDDDGHPVASQRLRSGELVLLARNLPPFSVRRYRLSAGEPHVEDRAAARDQTLDNGLVRLRVDPEHGGIVELRRRGIDVNLADTTDGQALNDFLYFTGDNPAEARRSGRAKIRVGESGPLVASLIVESDAPGCHALTRELQIVAGRDTVEIINTVDKDRLVAASYHAKAGKESLNFGFAFAVAEGQVQLEVPFGVMKPDDDQIPSACKNWFTVGRWADVSNDRHGVTWITLDAPLVQVGGLTANLLNSQSNPAVWRKRVGPTQKIYSWAMNNHWGTNYRAYQEGPHVFRFVLQPHGPPNPMANSRLAIAATQPLLVTGARGPTPARQSRLQLTSPEVLATALKPSDDGRAWIVRLWAGAGRDATTEVHGATPAPLPLAVSDVSERPRQPIAGAFAVPAWGVVTVRAELPPARSNP